MDIKRELDRFECEITSFPPDEQNPTALAEIAVEVLQVNYAFVGLYNISGKICFYCV